MSREIENSVRSKSKDFERRNEKCLVASWHRYIIDSFTFHRIFQLHFSSTDPVKLFFSLDYLPHGQRVFTWPVSHRKQGFLPLWKNPARTLSTFSSYFLYLSYYFFVQIFLRSSYTIEYYFIFREVSRSWLIERNRLLLLVNDLFERVKNDLSNFVILFFFLLSVND